MKIKGYQMVVDTINKQNFNPDKVYATLLSSDGVYAIDCIAGTTVTMHMLSAGNGYGIDSDSVVMLDTRIETAQYEYLDAYTQFRDHLQEYIELQATQAENALGE